jgi:hypothetical protein
MGLHGLITHLVIHLVGLLCGSISKQSLGIRILSSELTEMECQTLDSGPVHVLAQQGVPHLKQAVLDACTITYKVMNAAFAFRTGHRLQHVTSTPYLWRLFPS